MIRVQRAGQVDVKVVIKAAFIPQRHYTALKATELLLLLNSLPLLLDFLPLRPGSR